MAERQRRTWAELEGEQVDGMRIGGLMRCCIETLNDFYPGGPAKKAAEGDKLRCKHADPASDHGHMIFRDGAWEWDRLRDVTS